MSTNGTNGAGLTQAVSNEGGPVTSPARTTGSAPRDALKVYFGMRYSERETTLKEWKKSREECWKKVNNEQGRIEKIRERFEKSEGKAKLLEDMRKAFVEWKKEDRKERAQTSERQDHDTTTNPNVREKSAPTPTPMPASPPASTGVQEPEANDTSKKGSLVHHQRIYYTDDMKFEDVIEPPLDELKAGVMHFEKVGSSWEGVDYKYTEEGLCEGKFPDQKISMRNILERKDFNPFYPEKKTKDKIRYFHLPANHMDWIECVVAKYYEEDGKDTEDRKRTSQVLSREHWRGQLHGGALGKGPLHARHMRSRCSSIPLDTQSGVFEEKTDDEPEKVPPNFAIFLPYLHWETNKRRQKMSDIVQEVTKKRELKQLEKNNNDPGSSAIATGKLARQTPSTGRQTTTQANNSTKSQQLPTPDRADSWARTALQNVICKAVEERFKDKTNLGQYLFTAAQIWDAMDHEVDERLVRHGLQIKEKDQEDQDREQEPPLHIRRTLDQSFFLTLTDTSNRDQDQVVYRETRPVLAETKKDAVSRVVMVDQLWMWIMDDHTIITSFPRRWGRNKPDESGIHKSLRRRLGQMKKIDSVYHLALLIIDQCSRVFFDRTKPTDFRPEVMDLFAAAIGKVSDHTTRAYDIFWRNVEARSSNPRLDDIPIHNKYLDINPEGTLLREAQDIEEELNIMSRIFKQQITVVQDFRKCLSHHWGETDQEDPKTRMLRAMEDCAKTLHELNLGRPDTKTMPVSNGLQRTGKHEENERARKDDKSTQDLRKKAIQATLDTIEQIQNRQTEIGELQDAARRSCQQLQELLQLKQQQASIVEAKAALRRAEETNRQGRAIMAFTIVTIFFLPLGFLATFFGMNNTDVNGALWMSLGQQIGYMVGLSAIIITIALSVGFVSGLRGGFIGIVRLLVTAAFRIPVMWIWQNCGPRRMWLKFGHGEYQKAQRKVNKKLQDIENHSDQAKDDGKDEMGTRGRKHHCKGDDGCLSRFRRRRVDANDIEGQISR